MYYNAVPLQQIPGGSLINYVIRLMATPALFLLTVTDLLDVEYTNSIT